MKSEGVKKTRKLTIYKRYFYDADCYQKGTTQDVHGIQVHSTGANNPLLHRYVQPDDGRIGPNKYGNSHNRPGGDVCASAYIGKQTDGTVAVYQALPWNYRCWLSGNADKGNANKLGYIGYEICEDALTDWNYFDAAVLGVAVNLTAYLCNLYALPVDMVRDHAELHAMGIASNHGDITKWLKRFGLTMDNFRAAVQEAMNEGVEAVYIDCDHSEIEPDAPVLYPAEVTSSGAYLNLRKSKSTSSISLKKMYRGTVVDVLDDSNPVWWKVRCEGVTGYAMSASEKGETWLKPLAVSDDPGDDPGEDLRDGPLYEVTVYGLTWAEAVYLLETYENANAVETNG